MQIDMHFYSSYAVARMAGFGSDDAKTIATAAQFVDDAVIAAPILVGDESYLLPTLSAHKMIELDNLDEMNQWRVWLPFHFLPGNEGNGVEERLLCKWGEPGNEAADALIDLVLTAQAADKPYALHLLGIVTHVIHDTYAHYGFSGISSDLNLVDQGSIYFAPLKRLDGYVRRKRASFMDRLRGALAEASKLGHAAVATFPDRPYLRWEFDYENQSLQQNSMFGDVRDNPETFFMACTRLHAVYADFRAGMASATTDHLDFSEMQTQRIQDIIAEEGRKDERCRLWRDAIGSDGLFASAPGDRGLQYSDRGWTLQAMSDADAAKGTEAYRFNRAASAYLNAVLDDILPAMGILV